MRPGSRLAQRIGWGLGDQAFSSATNFVLGVMVARSLGSEEFGAFSLAFATYTLFLGLSRSLTSETLVVRFSHSSLSEWQLATAAGTGTATLLGILGGIGCIGFGVSAHGPLAKAFVPLGITLPGLLLQDAWRYAFFARGTGRQAFLSDLLWALVMFPAVVLLVATDRTSIWSLTLAWGGAGTVAGLIGILQGRVRPRPTLAIRWLRDQGDLASRYLGEFAAMSGARQLSFYAVGAIAGLAAAGAIRGAQVLLGPIQVLHNGIRLVAIPEAIRISKSSVHRMLTACHVLAVCLASVALLSGAVVFYLPEAVGVELLGPTWPAAHQVAIPLAIMLTGGGISMAAVVGLRALAAAERSFGTRVLVSVLQIAGTIGGAAAGGAVPAAWGLALGVWAGVPLWHWQLHRAVAEHGAAIDPRGHLSVRMRSTR